MLNKKANQIGNVTCNRQYQSPVTPKSETVSFELVNWLKDTGAPLSCCDFTIYTKVSKKGD